MISRRVLAGAALVCVVATGACSDDSKSETPRPAPSTGSSSTAAPSTTADSQSFGGNLLALTTADASSGRVQLQLVALDDQYRGGAPIKLGQPIADSEVPARASIAADRNVAWVVTSAGGKSQVRRVLATGATTLVTVDAPDAQIAVGAGAAWVAAETSVLQLSPTDGTIIATVPAAAFPTGFTARFIAVAGGKVWVASDNGGFVTIDPTSRVVTPQPSLLTKCKEPAQTPAELAANDRARVAALTVVGQFVDAVTSDGCGPTNTAVAVDPTSGARIPLALPGPTGQAQRALAAGSRLVVARVKSNDLVVVESGVALAPVALPEGALAETCGAGPQGVACTSGLDELAFVAVGERVGSKPAVETHRSRAIDGGALAWAVL